MYNHLKIYQDFDHGYIPRNCSFKEIVIKKQKNMAFLTNLHKIYFTSKTKI